MTTTTSDAVTITILGGTYAGQTWTGDLANAPVTMLIPEGIVSARTTEEAARQRTAIRAALEQRDAVEISAVRWALRVERAVAERERENTAAITEAARLHVSDVLSMGVLTAADIAAQPDDVATEGWSTDGLGLDLDNIEDRHTLAKAIREAARQVQS